MKEQTQIHCSWRGAWGKKRKNCSETRIQELLKEEERGKSKKDWLKSMNFRSIEFREQEEEKERTRKDLFYRECLPFTWVLTFCPLFRVVKSNMIQSTGHTQTFVFFSSLSLSLSLMQSGPAFQIIWCCFNLCSVFDQESNWRLDCRSVLSMNPEIHFLSIWS